MSWLLNKMTVSGLLMLLCSWHVIRFNLHDVIIVLSCAALTVLSFSAVTRPRVLNVLNRKVRLNKACGTIADCTFEELCDRVSLSDCYLVKSAIRKTKTKQAAEPSLLPAHLDLVLLCSELPSLCR